MIKIVTCFSRGRREAGSEEAQGEGGAPGEGEGREGVGEKGRGARRASFHLFFPFFSCFFLFLFLFLRPWRPRRPPLGASPLGALLFPFLFPILL